MANPRLVRYPALNIHSDTYRMTPDQIHDYEYQLRNAIQRLDEDEAIRPQDKRLISSAPYLADYFSTHPYRNDPRRHCG